MNNKQTFGQGNSDICSGDRPSTSCVQYFNNEIKDVYSKIDRGLDAKPDKGNTVMILTAAFVYTTLLWGVLLTFYIGLSNDKSDSKDFDKLEQKVTSIERKVGEIEVSMGEVRTTLKSIDDKIK